MPKPSPKFDPNDLPAVQSCSGCGETKPASDFYVLVRRGKPSLRARCKPCFYQQCSNWAVSNREKQREIARRYRAEKPDLIRSTKERWTKANAERIKSRDVAMRKANPEKERAHWTVGNALRYGKLVKKPCEICGSARYVDAHHDDYSKPLDVRWLCRSHHVLHHEELNKSEAQK